MMADSQSCVSTKFSCSPSGHSQSGKVKQPLVKATGLEEAALDLSKLRSPLDRSKSTKRRCRACQRKYMELGSVSCQADGVRSKGSAENKKDVEPAGCCVLPEQLRNCRTSRSDACSSHCSFGHARFVNRAVEDDSRTQTEQRLDEAACNFPSEVADAIKRIESGVLALRLIAEKLEADSHSGVAIEDMVPSSVCSSIQANVEKEISVGKMSCVGQTDDRTREFVQSQAQMASKCMNDSLRSQRQDQKANNILEKFLKFSQEPAGKKHQNGQYVYGLRVSPSPDEVAKKPSSSAPKSYQDSLIQGTLRHGRLADRPRSVQRPSMPSESAGFAARSVSRSMAPHLIASSIQSGSYRSKIRNVSKNMSRGRASRRSNVRPFRLEDSEEVASSSSSYGYMSTSQHQTASTRNSDTRSSEYSAPSNNSGRTSASSSRGSLGNSFSSSSSSQNQSASSPPPQRNARRKTRGSSIAKPTGRLRRLKDKLGLIFHHHHHHHHHHHQKESMWSNLHHMLGLGARKNEDHKKQAGERRPERRKAVVKKNQVGHFRGLVEGLMRHTKNSKKPETWKARKGHGVKLPSKGRTKLGLAVGNKKKLQHLNQFKKLT